MAWRGDIARHPAPPRATPRRHRARPRDPGTRPGVPVLEPCRLNLATRAGNRATGKRHHIGLQTTFPVALDYATAANV